MIMFATYTNEYRLLAASDKRKPKNRAMFRSLLDPAFQLLLSELSVMKHAEKMTHTFTVEVQNKGTAFQMTER